MGPVIHAYARCEGCQWEDSSIEARERAEQHTKKTGHTTRVEVMRSFTYRKG